MIDHPLATSEKLCRHHGHHKNVKGMPVLWMRETSWGVVKWKELDSRDSLWAHHHTRELLVWWASRFEVQDSQGDRGVKHETETPISMITSKDSIWDDQLHNSMISWGTDIPIPSLMQEMCMNMDALWQICEFGHKWNFQNLRDHIQNTKHFFTCELTSSATMQIDGLCMRNQIWLSFGAYHIREILT